MSKAGKSLKAKPVRKGKKTGNNGQSRKGKNQDTLQISDREVDLVEDEDDVEGHRAVHRHTLAVLEERLNAMTQLQDAGNVSGNASSLLVAGNGASMNLGKLGAEQSTGTIRIPHGTLNEGYYRAELVFMPGNRAPTLTLTLRTEFDPRIDAQKLF